MTALTGTLLRLGFAPLVCASLCFGLAASTAPVVQAQRLVREVVKNELDANRNDHSHWMYKEADVEPGKNIVQKCVQTRDGQICRILQRDGRMLSAEEQQTEKRQIEHLIKDPAEQKKKQLQHQDDDRKAAELMKMLPEGFLYQYDGMDGNYTRLRFEPNPDFTPPTREAMVFHCMAGSMLVEAQARRLVEIRGKLIRNVDFGWGLLGKLTKGGTFLVQRKDVGDGHWENTLLDVHIHGKALFFKTINAEQHEVDEEFKRVPDGLTLTQGASMLEGLPLHGSAAASK